MLQHCEKLSAAGLALWALAILTVAAGVVWLVLRRLAQRAPPAAAAPIDPGWYAQILAQSEAHRGNPSDEMAWDGTARIESRNAGTL